MEYATIVTTTNLGKVCRACLMEYEEMHSLFSEIQNEDNLEEEPTFLCELLMNISSIRVLAEDGLPSMICTNCMELAHTSYKFQQQCNRSQEILDAWVLQSKEVEDEEQVITETSEEVLQLFHPDLSPPNEELLQDAIDANIDRTIEDTTLTTEKECLEETMSIINRNLDVCDSGNVSSEGIIIKTEIKEEPTLDAAKIAASEDNIRLRQRLAIKRMKTDSTVKKHGQSAVDFSYYVKLNENGEKTYHCDSCGKSYKHSNSLKIHMRTHTLERPYICKHCGKGFKQYGALTYHLRSHTGEQPYGCKICGKRYRQSGTLTAHMRVHTGQKPFLCSVCGRGFRQAPDLGYHMRTHTKERPYMCNVCGKTMRMQCHLVQHMRIHTGERPFKCTECNKAFPSSTRLKRHAIIHTGLKPYTCEVCTKSFNRLSSLRVHAKIHTDERPHVCSFCGKGFIQAHALRGHLHTHSNADNLEKST